MEKDLPLWLFGCFVVATAVGTVLHFLLDWTGLAIFAPISAVNESTWEHMKILFFPMLFVALVQSRFFINEYPSFWWIKLIGILVGVLSIPTLFYTINGVFGKTPDWLNILFFFISAGLAYFIEWLLFRNRFSFGVSWLAVVIIVALALLFVVFTYFPPSLPIFQDPRIEIGKITV